MLDDCNIKCDEVECDWNSVIAFNDVPLWHNEPCPGCGKGVIINDLELEIFNQAKGLVDSGLLRVPVDEDEPGFMSVKIDTASLRNKEK